MLGRRKLVGTLLAASLSLMTLSACTADMQSLIAAGLKGAATQAAANGQGSGATTPGTTGAPGAPGASGVAQPMAPAPGLTVQLSDQSQPQAMAAVQMAVQLDGMMDSIAAASSNPAPSSYALTDVTASGSGTAAVGTLVAGSAVGTTGPGVFVPGGPGDTMPCGAPMPGQWPPGAMPPMGAPGMMPPNGASGVPMPGQPMPGMIASGVPMPMPPASDVMPVGANVQVGANPMTGPGMPVPMPPGGPGMVPGNPYPMPGGPINCGQPGMGGPDTPPGPSGGPLGLDQGSLVSQIAKSQRQEQQTSDGGKQITIELDQAQSGQGAHVSKLQMSSKLNANGKLTEQDEQVNAQDPSGRAVEANRKHLVQADGSIRETLVVQINDPQAGMIGVNWQKTITADGQVSGQGTVSLSGGKSISFSVTRNVAPGGPQTMPGGPGMPAATPNPQMPPAQPAPPKPLPAQPVSGAPAPVPPASATTTVNF